jgi:hypothetical protein
MKRLFIALVLMSGLFLNANSQISPNQDSQRGQTLQFWQWTPYGDPGYIFKYWNETNETVTVHITAYNESPYVSIDNTFVFGPQSYNVFTVGKDQYGAAMPYVEGLVFNADVDGHSVNVNLTVHTIGSLSGTSTVLKKKGRKP